MLAQSPPSPEFSLFANFPPFDPSFHLVRFRHLNCRDLPRAAMHSAMSSFCIPIISFLHVPGKMSRPLWLMMGTAFRAYAPTDPEVPLFLTAKHTFTPWAYVKDPSAMKIPDDYRKLRYVVGRAYGVSADGRAVAAQSSPMTLVATHPTLDVAVLRAASPGRHARADESGAPAAVCVAPALRLCTSPLAAGAHGTIAGFRGVGRLGEMDTFDPSLLDKLPPAERDAILKELQDVEGKQAAATVSTQVLDGRGMCRAVGESGACFHGMSGGPLLVPSGESVDCAGILYGRHPDSPANIGYTPAHEVAEWLSGVASRTKNAVTPPDK